LGRFTFAPVCAGAAEEADMAAETPVSHSLRVDPDEGSDWTAIIAVSLLCPASTTSKKRLYFRSQVADMLSRKDWINRGF
jgi:hypothetical protein